MSAVEHLGQQWFHGTIKARIKTVKPADRHRGAVTFPHDTDRGHAYATPNEDDAWSYAERAWHAGEGDSGHPRVYQVEPIGEHEPDPTHDEHGRHRGNFSDDVRSKRGFRVVREVPMPEHMGTPEDWR